jgi:hypothetical protein
LHVDQDRPWSIHGLQCAGVVAAHAIGWARNLAWVLAGIETGRLTEADQALSRQSAVPQRDIAGLISGSTGQAASHPAAR